MTIDTGSNNKQFIRTFIVKSNIDNLIKRYTGTLDK